MLTQCVDVDLELELVAAMACSRGRAALTPSTRPPESVRAGTEEYDEQAALQGEEKVRAAVMLAERKALAVEGSDGEPIRRKSAIVEAARVVAALTSHGVRTCLLYTSPSPRDRG